VSPADGQADAEAVFFLTRLVFDVSERSVNLAKPRTAGAAHSTQSEFRNPFAEQGNRFRDLVRFPAHEPQPCSAKVWELPIKRRNVPMNEVQTKARELAGRIYGSEKDVVFVGPNSKYADLSPANDKFDWVVVVVHQTGYRGEIFDLGVIGMERRPLLVASLLEQLGHSFEDVRVFGSASSLEDAIDAHRASAEQVRA
jgi:hypothetical protein